MLWVQILILLILIGMNAFFASSEVALISLKQSSIRKLIQRGGLRGKALAALTGNTGRFLATVQVGVTLAGFLASAFAAESFSDPLTEFLERIGFDIFSHSVLDMAVVVFITMILSYLSLVFGELMPKQIGLALFRIHGVQCGAAHSFPGKCGKTVCIHSECVGGSVPENDVRKRNGAGTGSDRRGNPDSGRYRRGTGDHLAGEKGDAGKCL